MAGTEPAGIFVSRDGAANWRECPEVGQLRDAHHWFLPYSPAAGCVRGFAFHGQRAYAAVEVGGVLRSDDEAQTWQLAAGSDGNPDLAGPPAPNEQWRMNLYRIERGEAEEFTAWSPTLKSPPDFHVPSRFGTLVFVEE